MAVTGTFRELDALRRRVRGIATPAFRRDLAKAVGAAAMKKLHDGFRAGVDPYGRRWKRVKLRTGQPLRDTGRGEASFSAKPTGKGFAINLRGSAYYMRTHQLGADETTEIGVIRPVVAKKLRFYGRGAPTKRQPRGAKSAPIFADEVRVPRRQIIPEARTGGLGTWGHAMNREAFVFIQEYFRDSQGGLF